MKESYFKKGARISTEQRRELTNALTTIDRPAPDQREYYTLARQNINRPWARRWLKANGYFR